MEVDLGFIVLEGFGGFEVLTGYEFLSGGRGVQKSQQDDHDDL